MLTSPKRSASWDEIQPKYHKIHDINEKSINFAYLKHPSPPKGNFPLYELIHYHFHDLLFAIFPSKTTALDIPGVMGLPKMNFSVLRL